MQEGATVASGWTKKETIRKILERLITSKGIKDHSRGEKRNKTTSQNDKDYGTVIMWRISRKLSVPSLC
jgi:hypothetical protein